MRHPRKRQGGTSKFFTRTQSLKKLQLSLKTFRQLCIYKGIHPRVPKKTGSDARVFYHQKDIKFMAHEPSIGTLRRQRQFHRKIRAAMQHKNRAEAMRLEKRFPKIALSHILKERYPTFQHALRDLDDPLTMAHLYANLHQQGQHRDAPELHAAASQLCAEFQAYVAKTHSLRKVFISVKGYYYQADIMGTTVTWCVPHKFVQNFNTHEIDPFIMTCYMEFYKTLLGFVNFRLFHSIGLHYPPQLTSKERSGSIALEVLLNKPDFSNASPVHQKLEEMDMETEQELPNTTGQSVEESTSLGATQDKAVESDDELVEIQSEEETEDPAVTSTAGVHLHDDATLCANLFNGLVFFCGRETPIDQLIFVIKAFGGVVAWEDEASTFGVSDTQITHCIVDRPTIKESFKQPGREYVQPQWIFDCCNARVLLPTDLYEIGKTVPPHLSPFVDNEEEEYVPDYAKEIQKIQEAANLLRASNDTSIQERAMETVLKDDVQLEEEHAIEKAQKEEEDYLKELELEMDFPTELSKETTVEVEAKRKLREQGAFNEKQRMEEIMVTNKYRYNKLKRKEISKKTKAEKLRMKAAHIQQQGGK